MCNCSYRSLQLEGGWLNLFLLIANLGLTQGRVVQCPRWKGTAAAPSPCWRGTLLEQQHQYPRVIKHCFLISGKGKSAELRKARNSSCRRAVTLLQRVNGLVSFHSWLILLGLLSQWTKCSGRTGKTKTMHHFSYFTSIFFILTSYLAHEKQKSVFFAQFLKLSEPIFYYIINTWFQEFLLPLKVGSSSHCSTNFHFLLTYSNSGQSVLWTCFPMIFVLIRHYSLINASLFIIVNANTTYHSGTPCYRA